MKKVLFLIGTLLLTTMSAFALTMPRWGMTSIDVYIPEHEKSDIVQRVFNEWAQASGGKLRFRFASTRFASNNSPIKVTITDQQAPFYQAKSNRHETTGYFTNMEDGFINRAELTVYTRTKERKTATDEQLYKGLLPEVGYILGLEKIYGTCEKSDSAMCMDPKNNPGFIKDEDKQLISEKYSRSSKDIEKHKSRNK